MSRYRPSEKNFKGRGRLQKEIAKVKKKEVSVVKVLSGDEEWRKNIQSGLAKHHELKLPSSHCSYFFKFKFSPKRNDDFQISAQKQSIRILKFQQRIKCAKLPLPCFLPPSIKLKTQFFIMIKMLHSLINLSSGVIKSRTPD